MKIKWAQDVDKDNYPAAESYLSLIFKKENAAQFVRELRRAPIVQFEAKDVLRASRLPIDRSSDRLSEEKRKVLKGEKLSPILLVRDERTGTVIIADGFHRLCVTYIFTEDAKVPAKIV
jgi:hypothetical protein